MAGVLDVLERFLRASRSAELPKNRGGLDLPEGNTALDRAAALGYDRPGFHGTGEDFTVPKGIMWSSETPSLANEYAFMREHMGGTPSVIPTLSRSGNTFDADVMSKSTTISQFTNELFKQAQERGQAVDIQEYLAKIRKLRAAAKREESGPNYDRHDFWYKPEQMFGREGKGVLQSIYDDLGIDSFSMMERGEKTFGVRNPANVRSRFAAFDPMLRDSKDLLAGVAKAVPAGSALGAGMSLSPEEAIAKAMEAERFAPMPAQPMPARYPIAGDVASRVENISTPGEMFTPESLAKWLRDLEYGRTSGPLTQVGAALDLADPAVLGLIGGSLAR